MHDTEDLQRIQIIGRENKYINKDKLLDGNELSDFKVQKCIISKRISDELSLKTGDKLKVLLNG